MDRFSSVSAVSSRINTVKDYCNDDYELHRKTVSDHVPIALKLNLK